MRAVLQRASRARVTSGGQVTGSFERQGIVVLLGVTHTDTPAQAVKMAEKIAKLRILDGEKSLLEAAAPVLVISQFTLYGNTRKGRRPSWVQAAPGPVAEPLYLAVVEKLAELGLEVSTGKFGHEMAVELTGDGPITLIVEVDA